MSDTPRTDATQFKPSEQHPAFNLAQYMVKAGFAQMLERENAAQLNELHRISEALGTNEGHSSVTHIESLKEENAALREQLATISKILHYPGCWDTAAYPDIESCIKEIWAICATCEIKEEGK